MRAILLLLLLAASVGCTTGYQKNGFNGGYNEERLGPDRYRISVIASGVTTAERAEQIMMLRAAELARQNGFQKFVVEAREMTFQHRTGYAAGVVINASLPTGYLVVRLLKANDPRANGAHDAASVEARLRPLLGE